ncbi:cytochrome P450 [Streptomyces sp. NPDC046161]|uniref:cytochrome P450 n=1 Tax=Streptomyces sp. NPDC046161 TaxID=3155132 RepID=UPI0033D6AC87
MSSRDTHARQYRWADAPRGLPVAGHLLPMLRDPLAFLSSLPAAGDLVRIRIGTFPVIVICDPDLTRQVLLDDRTFDKGGPLYDQLRHITGDSLGTCPHARHRRQRRLAQPAFHPTRFPGYVQSMSEQTRLVTDAWQEGQVLDVLAAMLNLTIRNTVETVFKGTLTPRLLDQATKDLTLLFRGLYRRALLPPWVNRLPTPANRRYEHTHARLRAMVDNIVTHRRMQDTDHGDLLSALLAARDTTPAPAHRADGTPGSSALNDTEISDQAMTFFIAGAETAANLLAWALHLLAQHPAIRADVEAEADTVLAGGPIRHEHLPQLECTRRVITETLRLYPPAWIFTRTTTTDTSLGGHPIPAGTTIAYTPYLIHRRPDLYTSPHDFNPDRWTTNQPPPPRGALIPFGAGARKCIGNEFAITESTIALATITARWRLHPTPDSHVRPTPALMLSPRGLTMRITPR